MSLNKSKCCWYSTICAVPLIQTKFWQKIKKIKVMIKMFIWCKSWFIKLTHILIWIATKIFKWQFLIFKCIEILICNSWHFLRGSYVSLKIHLHGRPQLCDFSVRCDLKIEFLAGNSMRHNFKAFRYVENFRVQNLCFR